MVFNTVSLSEKSKSNYADFFASFKEISLVFESKLSYANVVYFACKSELKEEEREGKNVVVIKNPMGETRKS